MRRAGQDRHFRWSGCMPKRPTKPRLHSARPRSRSSGRTLGLEAENGAVVKWHKNRPRQQPIGVSYSMADDGLRHIGAYHHVSVRKGRAES